MNQLVIDAVKERISLGYSKEAINKELTEGGYTSQEIEGFYSAAAGTTKIPAAPTPATSIPTSTPTPEPEPAPEAVVKESVVSTKTPADAVEHHRSYHGWLIGIGLMVIIGIIAAVGYVALTQSGSFSLNALFASEPYETSGELFIGVADSMVGLQDDMIAVKFHFDVELLEKQPGEVVPIFTQLADANALAAGTPIGVLPDEGHARFAMTGLVDGRDLENPKFDFSMSADVLVEPFIVQAAGSARLADNSLYARVDDMPAMFEPYYEAEGLAPIGTWMLLGTTEELGLSGNGTGLSPLQNIPTVPMILNAAPTITPLMSELQAALSQLPPAVATGPETMMASLASIQFPQEVDGPKIISLLEQYPPFVIEGSPTRVTTDQGDLYEYNVVPSLENVLALVRALPAAIEGADPQMGIEVATEFADEFPSQAELDEALQYFDMFLVVAPNGDFNSFSLRGEVTESADTKSKLSYTLTYGLKPAPGQTITTPTDVHPGSVIGDQIQKQEEQRAAIRESSTLMVLGNLRIQAELFYNENQFSYAGFCEDIAADFQYSSTDMACATTPDGQTYRVSAPLLASAGVYCVDGSGFAGEVAVLPADVVSCVVN